MDGNYEAGSEIFFEPPVKKDAKYYRATARKILKGSFWKLLWMLVITVACAALVGVLTYFAMQKMVFFSTSFLSLIAILLAVMALATALLSLVMPAFAAINRAQLRAIDGEGIRVSDLWRGLNVGFAKNALTGVAIIASTLVLSMIGIVGFLMMETAALSASPLVLLGVLLIAAAVVLLVWVSIRLAFVFHIRAEYPELSVLDSIRNSFALTKGNGKRVLGLSLSFLGWYAIAELISLATLGFGAVVACPVMVYHMMALTHLYQDLSGRNKADEVEFPSLDPDDYDPEAATW